MFFRLAVIYHWIQYTLEMNLLANTAFRLRQKISGKKVLFEGPGLYSSLRVTKIGQRINLYTGGKYLQSSYDPSKSLSGSHWDWYLVAPIFYGNFARKLNNALILGLGGGTVVKLYNRAYSVVRFVGVEIDPAIIEISKKFFNLNDPNLEIVNADIFNYITATTSRFDLIILDAFKENQSESKSLTPDFLKTCQRILLNNGVLVINRVNSKSNQAANKILRNELKTLYKNVYSLNIYYNVFYICTNSLQATDNKSSIRKSILKIASSNEALSFMKGINSLKLEII